MPIVLSFTVLCPAFIHSLPRLSFSPSCFSSGIFRSTSQSIWTKYWVGIRVTSTTEYLIWTTGHLLQISWLLYGISLIRRNVFILATQRGDPPFMPAKLYWVYTLSLVFLLAAFLTWDREQLWIALILVALAQIHLVICLYCSIQSIKECKLRLVHYGNRKEILFIILLVHNGLGVLATWLGFVTTFHLAVVVVYTFKGGHNVASGLAMSVIGLEMLIFAIIDVLVAWRHTLYLISPYLTLVTGFAGIVAATDEERHRGTVYEFGSALLALSVILNFAKISHTCYRVVWKGYSYDHCVADIDPSQSPMHGYGAAPGQELSQPRGIDAPLTSGVRELQRHHVLIQLNPNRIAHSDITDY